MNELLAPIIYCYASHAGTTSASAGTENEGMVFTADYFIDFDEADTFFSLVDMVGEFRDYYCKQLDNSNVGIRATLQQLSMRLKEVRFCLLLFLCAILVAV